jgi:2'-hydroxyisoflavone reductase
MPIRRREFLQLLAAGAAGCAAPRAATRAPAAVAVAPSIKPLRILVLGGTGFIGPHIVRTARAHGHTITLFNRGKTNPHLFPDVETILGDRRFDIDKLKGRDWDAVVDTWVMLPKTVRAAAELLKDHVAQYLFVSTISVYKLGTQPLDENSETLTVTPEQLEKPDLSGYGGLKALAERAAEEVMPGRATSLRAGVIVGAGDPTGRFLYWPRRIERGGDVLVPCSADARMQFIDARDLGDFIVHALEQRIVGTYNCVGPDDPMLGHVLEAINGGVAEGKARFVYADYEWLGNQDAIGWDKFPLVVANESGNRGFGHVDAARAIAKGLRFRAVADTAKEALAWWKANGEPQGPGITAEREVELLTRWRAQANKT